MTRLFVDQQEINIVPKNLLSLDEILKHVEDSHLEPDTVIRQVHVDGRPLIAGEVDAELVALAHAELATATVEIFTGRLSAIVLESAREAAVYVARLEAAIPSLAMALRSDPSPRSFEDLKQFCDGFLWLNLLLAKLGGERPCKEGDTSDVSALQGLISTLNELVQAQERKDLTIVADLLEYEILALLPDYRRQFLDLGHKLSCEQNK